MKDVNKELIKEQITKEAQKLILTFICLLINIKSDAVGFPK